MITRNNSDIDEKVRDPVCDMWVDPDSHAVNYLGILYAFCSRQCYERFIANPHVYVGLPGKPAPKQQGMEIIKRRVLRLSDTLSDDQADILMTELDKMMGIRSIAVEKDYIHITYDMLQVTTKQIETTIESTGRKLGGKWGEKLKLAFIDYLEEVELDSLE